MVRPQQIFQCAAQLYASTAAIDDFTTNPETIGEPLTVTFPAGEKEWTQYTIDDIEVTNGQLTIGFVNDGVSASAWAYVDSVVLRQKKTLPAPDAPNAEYLLGKATVTIDAYRTDPGVEIAAVRLSDDKAAPASLLSTGNAFSIHPAGKASANTIKGLADNFTLAALDENTLVLAPKPGVTGEALAKLKSSYKMQVMLENGDRKILFDNVLTVKINKKLPKITAQAIQINTFYDDKTAPIRLTGGTAATVVPSAKDKLLRKGWLKLNAEAQTVEVVKNDKAYSGTLYIDVTPEGWSQAVTVGVKVKASSTPPAA